jgi:hypothetical protein
MGPVPAESAALLRFWDGRFGTEKTGGEKGERSAALAARMSSDEG